VTGPARPIIKRPWKGLLIVSSRRLGSAVNPPRCGRKFHRCRSRFLPPRSSRQNSRALFGREEPKGGERSGVIPNGDPRSSSRFARYGTFVGATPRTKMSDETRLHRGAENSRPTSSLHMSAENQIGADQPPTLISIVRQALVGLGEPATELDSERTLAVPIRRSVHPDYVVCLECGWRGQMLRRSLATGHRMTASRAVEAHPYIFQRAFSA
jgi:ROS/MUCR transcriptional regulator protein